MDDARYFIRPLHLADTHHNHTTDQIINVIINIINFRPPDDVLSVRQVRTINRFINNYFWFLGAALCTPFVGSLLLRFKRMESVFPESISSWHLWWRPHLVYCQRYCFTEFARRRRSFRTQQFKRWVRGNEV